MNATKSEVTEKYAASLEYHLLPRDAGQAVDYRYAVGEINGWCGLFCRRCDADGSVSYSYQLIRDDNTVEFDPINGRLPRAMEETYRIGNEAEESETDADDYEIIEGMTIQHDASGQGHCWRDLLIGELPANIRQEIEAEIIDGGNDACPDYVASNGLHYRW